MRGSARSPNSSWPRSAAIRSSVLSTLRRCGEFWALEAPARILFEYREDVSQPSGVYSSAEAELLASALADWVRDQGGEDAAIAALIEETGTKKRLVVRAYRALKKSAKSAATGRFGLVWLFDGPAAVFPGY